MSEESAWSLRRPGGFTLIEVIGALVIFAVGVLMVIQSSGALSDQMRYSARTSEIVVLAHEWLDSLEATPFDSLTVGSSSDTVTVSGLRFRRRAVLTLRSAVLMEIEVSVAPADTTRGPSYTARSYSAAYW